MYQLSRSVCAATLTRNSSLKQTAAPKPGASQHVPARGAGDSCDCRQGWHVSELAALAGKVWCRPLAESRLHPT